MNKEEIEELKDFTIDITNIDELALGLEVCSKKSNMVIQEFANLIIELEQENQELKETLERINNYLDKNYTVENQYWFDHIQDIVKDRQVIVMNKEKIATTYEEYKNGAKQVAGFGRLGCYQGLDYLEKLLENDKYYSEQLEDSIVFIESHINSIEKQNKKYKEVIDKAINHLEDRIKYCDSFQYPKELKCEFLRLKNELMKELDILKEVK